MVKKNACNTNGYKKCMHSPKNIPAPLDSEEKILAVTTSFTLPQRSNRSPLKEFKTGPNYKIVCRVA